VRLGNAQESTPHWLLRSQSSRNKKRKLYRRGKEIIFEFGANEWWPFLYGLVGNKRMLKQGTYCILFASNSAVSKACIRVPFCHFAASSGYLTPTYLVFSDSPNEQAAMTIKAVHTYESSGFCAAKGERAKAKKKAKDCTVH